MYYISGDSENFYMNAQGSHKPKYPIIFKRSEEGTAADKIRVRESKNLGVSNTSNAMSLW